ncbi:hypothetical protein HBB16_05365 [Pseudonocardia sp. MCCB 268]|nr:hypothetical protein [Pseudonocardia cytotoxica]
MDHSSDGRRTVSWLSCSSSVPTPWWLSDFVEFLIRFRDKLRGRASMSTRPVAAGQ